MDTPDLQCIDYTPYEAVIDAQGFRLTFASRGPSRKIDRYRRSAKPVLIRKVWTDPITGAAEEGAFVPNEIYFPARDLASSKMLEALDKERNTFRTPAHMR